jgi:hypothetical protein
MKYISIDITSLNNIDDISDVISMGIMFGDTDFSDIEYLEFNIVHNDYLLKHSEIMSGTEKLRDLIDSERIACYFENLISYICLHLSDLSISEGDKIQIVTSKYMNKTNILRSVFINYDLDLFNIPTFVGHMGNTHREICENQGKYFEKFCRISR